MFEVERCIQIRLRESKEREAATEGEGERDWSAEYVQIPGRLPLSSKASDFAHCSRGAPLIAHCIGLLVGAGRKEERAVVEDAAGRRLTPPINLLSLYKVTKHGN